MKNSSFFRILFIMFSLGCKQDRSNERKQLITTGAVYDLGGDQKPAAVIMPGKIPDL